MGDCSWEDRCRSFAFPKKPNEMKADLQNSTAAQDDRLGRLMLDRFKSSVLFKDLTPSAVEARCFRYGDNI